MGAFHERTLRGRDRTDKKKRLGLGEIVFGKSGFWLGVAVGVLVTYFWIYHGGSVVRSVSGWFEKAASEFRGDESVREADRVLQ